MQQALQEQYLLLGESWHCLHANAIKADTIAELASAGLDCISCPNPYCDGILPAERKIRWLNVQEYLDLARKVIREHA
jgi:hypothetical protein